MGIDALTSCETWIDIMNAKGGLNVGGQMYKIQIVAYDSQNSQTATVSACNRLIYQDNIKFIMHDPQLVETYIPICEANKVVLVGGTPSQATVAGGLKYSFNPNGANFGFPIALSWYVKNNPDKITNYVFAAPDDQNGHFSIDMFMEPILLSLGVKPQKVYYPAGTTDLSAVATKIMSLNPTTVDCSGGGDLQDSQAVKAVYQAGYRGQFFTGGGTTADTLKQFIPAESAVGLMCSGRATEFEPALTQEGKDFKASYIAKHGKWESIGVSGELMVLFAAIEQAGSLDPDKVMDVVYNGMKWESNVDGPGLMVGRPDLPNYDGKTRDSLGTHIIKVFGEDFSLSLKARILPDEGLSLYQMVHPDYLPR